MLKPKILMIGTNNSIKYNHAGFSKEQFEIVYPYLSNKTTLTDLIKNFDPSVIITNLYFKERTIQEAINSLNIVRKITSSTDIKVIILTECDNTAVYQYALLSGINGYIHINGSRDINIAKRVEQMIYGPRIKPSRKWLTLTEWMVCHSLITQPSALTSERAKALKMSESNYYRLLSQCQAKTGARSTLELAVKFMSPAKALAT